MNKTALLAHNTTHKAVVIRESDRTRVYKYTETPADILRYALPPETEDIIRALLPLTE